MAIPNQYHDDECIYLGGDPRLEPRLSGLISIGDDSVRFAGTDSVELSWSLSTVRFVGFQPGYVYTADEVTQAYSEAKRLSQARGWDLAHFQMDDIPPGVLLKIDDPEEVLPDGWPVRLGFRSVYFARVFEKRLRLAANLCCPGRNLSLSELLADGENEQLEFKERWTPSCVKSVNAFLNTTGGMLLIGITDNGNICGINDDDFKNEDEYVLRVINCLRHKLTIEARDLVTVNIVADHTVCQINCQSSAIPVYCRSGSGSADQLFIRRGPSTEKLEGRNLLEYCRMRF